MAGLESVLGELVGGISHLSGIRAIGLSGGDRPLPAPGEGDLDIFVYCDRIPLEDQRRDALDSLGKSATNLTIGAAVSSPWGVADSFDLAGVETWLMYFTVADAENELAALVRGERLKREDNYYYPQGRCAMWLKMRALHDPNGFLSSLKARLAQYPAGLTEKALAYHMGALGDTEDLERAMIRKDVLFYHFALDLAMDHFLQALFALNRAWFPSRKRSLDYISGFETKPVDCEARLLSVIQLAGNSETLERSLSEWMGMVTNLVQLVSPE